MIPGLGLLQENWTETRLEVEFPHTVYLIPRDEAREVISAPGVQPTCDHGWQEKEVKDESSY